MVNLITTWSEISIETPSYLDTLELIYDSDDGFYYIYRHSFVGNIIEKIKLIPETIYKLDS